MLSLMAGGMGAKSSLLAVELFAGIGGFRIACDNLGIETIWANDIKPDACGVYRYRFSSEEIVEGDIGALKTEIPSSYDILTAGFPCQPFSSAGKKLGVEDTRGTLFREIHEIIQVTKPKAFLLENVKRLLSMQEGEAFKIILSTLSKLDYSIEWRLVNCRSFGIPQNRERVFIAGIRNDCVNGDPILRLKDEDEDILKPATNLVLHKGRFNTWGSVSDGLLHEHNYPSKVAEYGDTKLLDILQKPEEINEKFYFTESTLKRIGDNTPKNKFVQGVEILSNQEGGRRMGYTVFGVSGVAPTLTATTSRIYERYQIDSEYRILTNIEYARLQGFPDQHCDFGADGDGNIEAVSPYDQYSLYGNAIPPQLAQWGLERIINHFVN